MPPCSSQQPARAWCGRRAAWRTAADSLPARPQEHHDDDHHDDHDHDRHARLMHMVRTERQAGGALAAEATVRGAPRATRLTRAPRRPAGRRARKGR